MEASTPVALNLERNSFRAKFYEVLYDGDFSSLDCLRDSI